jgi:CPA1 family monovalent cation:H+ antiporter
MGFALGSIGWFLISRCKDNSLVAVHISLAIVMGGYALSSMLHVSGALAMVIAGLVMGRQLANVPDDNQFKTDLNTFWKIIDEVLNAVLFLLIGLEIVSFEFDNSLMLLSLISIVTVILSRFASLTLSGLVLNKNHNPGKKGILLMTWAGLRGGISIALALSLPESSFRETFLFVTYAIVVFSILVQGLTLENLSKRFYPTHN